MLVGHPLIREAAVIGVPHQTKGSELVCFCVLSNGQSSDDKLVDELKNKISAELGKPLRPREVILVSDLPKTRNGKIMRRVIRNAYLGSDPGDISSMANPSSMKEIIDLK